jgi:uncharacterized damage-inducible protein DinB
VYKRRPGPKCGVATLAKRRCNLSGCCAFRFELRLAFQPVGYPQPAKPGDGKLGNAQTLAEGYTPQDLFQNLARYNERANHEMFECLSTLTGRARRRDVGSWFGSIHGILNHVIICDINWLRRYRALWPDSPVLNDPRLDPPNLSWNHDLHDDLKGLNEHRAQVDALIRAWFQVFPPERYNEPFQYQDSVGAPRSAVAGRAFEFLFLHQTHHRGQISQILDTLGLPNNLADNAAYLE